MAGVGGSQVATATAPLRAPHGDPPLGEQPVGIEVLGELDVHRRPHEVDELHPPLLTEDPLELQAVHLPGDHEDVPEALAGLLLAAECPGERLLVDETGSEERLPDGRDGEWVVGDGHVAHVVGPSSARTRRRGRMFDRPVD
jgi:hypothetical protein